MVSDEEKERYLLPDKRDLEILELIHDLEKQELSDYEKFLVLWTRSQLQRDWRTPLLQILKILRENLDESSEERIKKIQEFADKNFWRH